MFKLLQNGSFIKNKKQKLIYENLGQDHFFSVLKKAVPKPLHKREDTGFNSKPISWSSSFSKFLHG